MSTAITRIVDGWTLDITDEEPRVRDVDLAERAGLKQPRDIRKVIERCREELEEFGALDMRVHCARISKPRGGFEEREVREFWLTEHQALAVLLQLRTPQARRLRGVLVRLFIAVRRGQLTAPQQVAVLSSAPLVGGSRAHRAELASWCQMAARNNGVSVHRVHGELRRLLRVPGVYLVPLVLYPQAREIVESLALGRLLLPSSKAKRHLAAVPADPAQRVFPFPGP